MHLLASCSQCKHSVLWHCWLGGRKGIRPVKNMQWWGAGVVICLERGANDLHMVQLMPLPPQYSFASAKSRMVYPSGTGLPRLSLKRPLNVCVCVWVYVWLCHLKSFNLCCAGMRLGSWLNYEIFSGSLVAYWHTSYLSRILSTRG